MCTYFNVCLLSFRLGAIIEATGASTYHGFLPSLVRDCVASFTVVKEGSVATVTSLGTDEFPLSFATALFSFLYHLATYEASKLERERERNLKEGKGRSRRDYCVPVQVTDCVCVCRW